MVAAFLVASLALAAVAWLTGLGLERLGLSALVRVRLWTTALLAVAAIAPGLWLVNILNISTPWPAAIFQTAPVLPKPLQALAPVHSAPSSAASQTVDLPAVAPAGSAIPWNGLLMAALLFGFGVRMTRRLTSYRSLRQIIARSTPIWDEALAGRAAAAAHRLSVAVPQLRQGLVTSPLAIRHPRIILLPSALVAQLGHDRLSLVCGHEIAHLKRGDDLTMAAFDLLACLFWFNPFMIAIDQRLSAAREEVCDRMAMGDLGHDARRAYAETLVSTFKLCSATAVGPAFLGLRGNPARQRLLAVLEPVRPSYAKAALATGVAVILLAGAGGVSLAFAGAPPIQGDPWLVVHPQDGLTDADRAWLIMRSVQYDIVTEVRNLSKAPDPARMRAFIDKSDAQVAEIHAKIRGKPISERAQKIDRDNYALRDQAWAEDAAWDGPPPHGIVRATVYCAPDQPCTVKSLTADRPTSDQTYRLWARQYAELMRQDQPPHAPTSAGILVKADLTPAVLAHAPSPNIDLNTFLGMGPEGMPPDVVPPPET
jgi:beta-lactamase regulating signal transducer with metallopeptidase domain